MTLTKPLAPKQTTVFFSPSKSIPLAIFAALLLTSMIGPALAQQAVDQDAIAADACTAGYAETWIIGQSCFVGRSMDVKTNDAIHISCAGNNDYSIAFFIEPAGSDPATSNAVQHDVCPGNGYITRNADGEQVLRCNFWESVDNVAKQLEVQLQPAAYGETGRSMSWQASELDNPNVVCGVSGRPNDDSETVGSGRTS